MKKGKTIINWILRVLLFLGLLMASAGKLTNNAQVIEMFDNWGYPAGFYFVVGVIELVLAILILIPRTLKLAVIGISILLISASITHLVNDPISELIRPLIFFLVLGGIFIINFRNRN